MKTKQTQLDKNRYDAAQVQLGQGSRVPPTVTTVVGGGSHPPGRKLSEGLVFFPSRPDNPLVGPILYLICMHAHSTNQSPLGSIYVSR